MTRFHQNYSLCCQIYDAFDKISYGVTVQAVSFDVLVITLMLSFWFVGVRAAFQAISFPIDPLVYQQQKVRESRNYGSVRCNPGMIISLCLFAFSIKLIYFVQSIERVFLLFSMVC